MKPIARAVALACALAGLAIGAPAAAQVTVSFDQAAFDSSHAVTTSSFSFASPFDSTTYSQAHPIGSYTSNGVTFSGDGLFAAPAQNAFISNELFNLGTPLNISSTGSVLGLYFYNDGANTIDYALNGTTSGTVIFGAINTPVFMGIDTGNSEPINIRFSGGQAYLNIVSFQTGALASAAPEPDAWSLMLLGFGAIGWALRRQHATNPRTRFA